MDRPTYKQAFDKTWMGWLMNQMPKTSDATNFLKNRAEGFSQEVARRAGPPTRPLNKPQAGSPQDVNPRGAMDVDPRLAQPVQAPMAPAPVKAAMPTPTKVQDRLAPNQYSDKGAMPTPKPNPWKTMGRELINQMATPGYYDRDRGVWVGSAHAYADKKAGKERKNKTIEFLKRKGYSNEDAEAIVANPEISKSVMAAVSAPKGFGGKETTFDRELAKDAAEWGAKRQDVVNDIKALDEATKYLEDQVNNPDWLNQNTVGSNFYRTFAPDKLQTLTESGRELKSNRDLVYSITAKNLKLILGGQFAQKEGEQLLARTYDKDLLPEENLMRVRRLQDSMKRAYVAKERLYARDDLTPEQKARGMEDIKKQLLAENSGGTKGGDTSGGFTYLGTE